MCVRVRVCVWREGGGDYQAEKVGSNHNLFCDFSCALARDYFCKCPLNCDALTMVCKQLGYE